MNKFEKILFASCIAVTCIFTANNIIAKDLDIAVAVDGDYIDFDEETGMPFAKDGRTLVPLRKTMETMLVNVEWNQELYRAELKKGFDKVIVPVDESYIIVNDKHVTIDSEAIAYEGRIYLPIRAVCEAFGYTVEWDALSHVVEISSMCDEEIPEGLYDSNATITCSDLRVRTSPNLISTNIVDNYYLQNEDRVLVLSKRGVWYKISDGDNIYYINDGSSYGMNFVEIDKGVDIEIEEIEYNYTYDEWVDGKVTYYCACTICCGPTAKGLTASGAHVEEGLTCAADWSIYPCGSWVEIEGYGVYQVQDRGGAVKGQHIDIYCAEHSYASTFGTKPARIRRVYIEE